MAEKQIMAVEAFKAQCESRMQPDHVVALTAENDLLRQKLLDADTLHLADESSIANLERIKTELTAERDALQQQLADISRERDYMAEVAHDAKAERDVAQIAVSELRDENATLRRTLRTDEDRLRQWEQRAREAQTDMMRVVSDRDALQAQVASLTSALAQCHAAIAGLFAPGPGIAVPEPYPHPLTPVEVTWNAKLHALQDALGNSDGTRAAERMHRLEEE